METTWARESLSYHPPKIYQGLTTSNCSVDSWEHLSLVDLNFLFLHLSSQGCLQPTPFPHLMASFTTFTWQVSIVAELDRTQSTVTQGQLCRCKVQGLPWMLHTELVTADLICQLLPHGYHGFGKGVTTHTTTISDPYSNDKGFHSVVCRTSKESPWRDSRLLTNLWS